MNFINWLIIVYTDNHDLFEAHLLRQLKDTCEFIRYVSIFISFSSRTETVGGPTTVESLRRSRKLGDQNLSGAFSNKMAKRSRNSHKNCILLQSP